MRTSNFGDCRLVGSGVFELRIDIGPGYRVYFGKDTEIKIVLLTGGNKKTQKRDIEKAHDYWDDYRR